MFAKIKRLFGVLALSSLLGCAGTMRGCAGWSAENFGADWVVVQFNAQGAPMNCWKLPQTSIGNEAASDGVWGRETSGHLVHVSGWYNRVQVSNGDWSGAAKALGVDIDSCGDGRYGR
jgi:hypothetical protein